MRGREGLRGRRPHPLGRGDRSARARRALPDWKAQGAPLNQPVTEDRFLFLSRDGLARRCPTACCPAASRNHGNYIASLGNVVPLARHAGRGAGRRDLSGLRRRRGALHRGRQACAAWPPATWASASTARRPSRYQPGMELHAKYTVFAEGCRGHLGKAARGALQAARGRGPQVYGIGLKELWEVKPEKHVPGPRGAHRGLAARLRHLRRLVPLPPREPPGRGGLRRRPRLRRTRTSTPSRSSSATRPIRRSAASSRAAGALAYGARAISAGGLQSLPKLTFPGGVLVGDDAGFLNAARIKGSHAAIKSGMLAAEAAFEALAAGRAGDELAAYPAAFERAGCTTSCTARATSSRSCRRASTRRAAGGHRPGASSAARRRGRSPTRTPTTRRCGPSRSAQPDRVSEARRRAHLRPPLLGVRLEHQPRGRPARAPAR